ncbi:hypothetical protein [Nonomuraea glycinis]|uniref:hypothetical protein n=1 Tax=Nonomuraea glycinis TaxID=2047744 RepID=UPI002E1078A6|nr:hypothetical protein OHA68_43315 [Nonomuraea glycinis]
MLKLREEARGLVAITYYAAALQSDRNTLRCLARLVEIARTLQVQEPPSMAELAEDPKLIDKWAGLVGIGPVWGW